MKAWLDAFCVACCWMFVLSCAFALGYHWVQTCVVAIVVVCLCTPIALIAYGWSVVMDAIIDARRDQW